MSRREVLLIFKHLFNEPSQYMTHDSRARSYEIWRAWHLFQRHQTRTLLHLAYYILTYGWAPVFLHAQHARSVPHL
jgi:hypothetical protein